LAKERLKGLKVVVLDEELVEGKAVLTVGA
jgi:hypothetical protein